MGITQTRQVREVLLEEAMTQCLKGHVTMIRERELWGIPTFQDLEGEGNLVEPEKMCLEINVGKELQNLG